MYLYNFELPPFYPDVWTHGMVYCIMVVFIDKYGCLSTINTNLHKYGLTCALKQRNVKSNSYFALHNLFDKSLFECYQLIDIQTFTLLLFNEFYELIEQMLNYSKNSPQQSSRCVTLTLDFHLSRYKRF